MTDPRPENFEVGADRDGGMSLRCTLYEMGDQPCWWERDIGHWNPDYIQGSDLGTLLAAAREHLTEAHRTVIDGEVQP